MRDIEELARLAVDGGFKVHKELGPGLLESVYEAILAVNLARSGLAVERQKPVNIEYEGMILGEGFRADVLVEGRLIIELKSVERLSPLHGKQLFTYLRLLNQPLGLLMNFGAATFREGVRRIVNNHTDVASSPLRVNQIPTIRVGE
ncbi:MAG TPA: GxxExxY protein [Allosphingosinicella sp.]|nr:GxxExxY protein [Allosphingosinicella sp.]